MTLLAPHVALPSIFSTAARDTSQDDAMVSVRLRLVSCRVEHGRNATSAAVVECEGPAIGHVTTGRMAGSASPAGDLRLMALATLDAVTQATCGAMRLELVGVKPLRAFDENLVVVAVTVHLEGATHRVVGSAIADEDPVVGTAKATLHAINRLASPLLARLVPDRVAHV